VKDLSQRKDWKGKKGKEFKKGIHHDSREPGKEFFLIRRGKKKAIWFKRSKHTIWASRKS